MQEVILFIREYGLQIWSFIALPLGSLAYHLLERNSKRKEIKYSYLHQNKFEALKDYFQDYTTVKIMLKQIPYLQFLENRISTKEMDEITWPPINKLITSSEILSLYFNESIYGKTKEILDNIYKINKSLQDSHHFGNPKNDLLKISNAFYLEKQSLIEANDEIVRVIKKELIKSL